MAFKEGESKPAKSGRKKGTPNKRTFDAQELAQEMDCDPLKVLLMIMKNDWRGMGYKSEFKTTTIFKKKSKSPNITLDMRLSAAREAVKYLYPQRKALEHSGAGGVDILQDLLRVIDGSKNP